MAATLWGFFVYVNEDCGKRVMFTHIAADHAYVCEKT